jgi:hypothetical protein
MLHQQALHQLLCIKLTKTVVFQWRSRGDTEVIQRLLQRCYRGVEVLVGMLD